MEAVRGRWTDERMDDLNVKVDELGRRMDNGFNRVDADIKDLRGEMHEELKSLRGEMVAGFERFDERFERLHRLIIHSNFMMFGTVIAAFITVTVTQL